MKSRNMEHRIPCRAQLLVYTTDIVTDLNCVSYNTALSDFSYGFWSNTFLHS